MNRNSAAMLIIALAALAPATSSVASGADSAAHRQRHQTVRPRPANLDTSLERSSDRGLYRVRIECLETPMRPHRIHTWAVQIEHAGAPIEDATITVDGGMPEHGHGYPTKPKVEATRGGGYAIRGMKFSMRGWWELKLRIESKAGSDQLTFNVVV